MTSRNLLIQLLVLFTLSGCAGFSDRAQEQASSATIVNFKADSDKGTSVAQLMCFKRHLAPYIEIDRNVPPAEHEIFIRVVDYAYMLPALRDRTEWGGNIKKGSYLMLNATLTAGQTVTIQRRDKDRRSYVWLQDKVTGQAVSAVKFTTLKRQFNINSDYLDRECAKGTV
ncbi:hypothetical protein [Paraglaciecola sp.]|uniref:hypothetical protein n=1 Tax=Paraglaciecola sp. TaxID=1920173 RepID=UPI0027400553|nr:hypothetical protein [Paraglaciecola sp.]MDP5030364.1 hypothetical protein [Paraglaciecola sp.]